MFFLHKRTQLTVADGHIDGFGCTEVHIITAIDRIYFGRPEPAIAPDIVFMKGKPVTSTHRTFPIQQVGRTKYFDAVISRGAIHVIDALLMRSEEHTSELQSLMRISYAVFCLKKKTQHKHH